MVNLGNLITDTSNALSAVDANLLSDIGDNTDLIETTSNALSAVDAIAKRYRGKHRFNWHDIKCFNRINRHDIKCFVCC